MDYSKLNFFKASYFIWICAAWSCLGVSHSTNAQVNQQTAKQRIVLAGDSTVTDESGWGKGFAELLNSKAECINLAKSGRSSRSYRSEGWWTKCLEASPDYLLIQFGHNDQPGKGPERESAAESDFRIHLRDYVREARQQGIKPVLISSLTRRRWSSDGKIEPTLADYAEATRRVSEELDVPFIDLHQLSIQQCEQIGPIAFREYEPMDQKGADHTHLNLDGSRAVGSLVADALVLKVADLADAFDRSQRDLYRQPQEHSRDLKTGKLQLSETQHTISISLSGRPLLTYNVISPPAPAGIDSVFERSGFIHPVFSPSGRIVTQAFPFDHAHQHGIFSAWVNTKWQDREIDFWNLAKRNGRVMHQRVVSTFADAGRIGFEVNLIHRAVQDPVVDILRERWKITAWETDGSYLMFDLHSHQTALTDSPLTIEKYHYGGIAYRGPVRWLSNKEEMDKTGENSSKREPFEFVNDQGLDRIQGNAQHTRWVVATGQIDEQPVTIAVLSHQDNFRAPQAARLHSTKPYFVFSPCIDGAFSIDRDHSYQATYRYLIIDGKPDSKWIESQWHQWHTH